MYNGHYRHVLKILAREIVFGDVERWQ
jgi:hypothetical protein